MPDTNPTSEAFHRFMEGFSAWALRAAHASDTANWLEALVLQVGLIDAMLRVGVILKRQLVTGNNQIDLKLVYQDEETGYYSERQVYRMAVEESVIDKHLFGLLNDAYDRRNRAIHRLFLAEVTYRDLRYLSEHYETLIRRCSHFVYNLEKEQIRTGRGMTRGGSSGPSENATFWSGVRKRLGVPDHTAHLIELDAAVKIGETAGWTLEIHRRRVQIAAPQGVITVTTARLSDPGLEADAMVECERLARTILAVKKDAEVDPASFVPFPKPLASLPPGLQAGGDRSRAWLQLRDSDGVQWIAMASAKGPKIIRASYNGNGDQEELTMARRVMESIGVA